MGLFDKFKKKKEEKDAAANAAMEEQVNSPEEKPSNQKPPDFFKINSEEYTASNSAIFKIWDMYRQESGSDEVLNIFEHMEHIIDEFKMSQSNESEDFVESELLKFLRDIHVHCDKLQKKILGDKVAAEKNHGSVPPVNAEPLFYMAKGKVRLFAVIVPPLFGGNHLTEEALRAKLDSMSVKTGIDNKMLKRLAAEKMFFKVVQLAEGREPVHGKNGVCKELFSKHIEHANFKEDMHGNVNYKELNMIQSVHKGETLCEITLPTEKKDGVTVTGEVITAREGKYPAVPAGKNTEFNEDKTLLLAKIDGEVTFEDGKFCVKNLLTIDSDVDNAVGNIDFTGDVLIKGGVREGYTVKAEGDVHITGTVEGATVIVGGDLQIDRGMTGGNKGYIEVQGSLKCRYLENCKVYAKEGVEADQIINCSISTDKDIIVKGKKGSVTGGRLIAGGKLEAVTIGTPMNNTLKTEIVIGVIPHLIEQKKDLESKLEASQNELLKMTQDITYINSNKNVKNITPERKELLKNLLSQYQIDQMKNKKIEAELADVNEKIQVNTENCGMKCDHVYPIMCLNVCGLLQVINKEITECKIVRKNNKTYVMGSNLESMIIF